MNDIQTTYHSLETSYLDITKKYLNINEHNVEQALLTHTGVYAFFGAVLAYAKREMENFGFERDREEAKVKEDRRQELIEEGKKATDRALESYVITCASVADAQHTHQEASHKYYLAKNILNSLDHQKDMLVQISANKRAESKLIGDNYTS